MQAMNAFRIAAVVAIAVCQASAIPASAAWRSPQMIIAGRLHAWSQAFNARDRHGICDLFAADLIATVPEAPPRNRDQVCANLRHVLSHMDRRMHYASDIHEIIVSGDLAIVRLDWRLSVTRATRVETTLEHGMDVFRKDRAGSWSIIRYIAFSEAPAQKD
jgi:ketosteroid isomerase-like protein